VPDIQATPAASKIKDVISADRPWRLLDRTAPDRLNAPPWNKAHREGAHLGMIERAIAQLSSLFMWLSAGTVFVVMALMVLDVLLRYFLNAPLRGTFEIVEMALVGIVFLALGHTQRTQGHVAVDLVAERLPSRLRRVTELVSATLACAISGVMTASLVLLASAPGASRETTDLLHIPTVPFRWLAAAGMALLTVELALRMAATARDLLGRRSAAR